ncbi:hypothetical protein EVAR_16408_1 [Eumeta japonica]|uniref:Fibronectin type-III domain-containing protein n=1 Tax=Eumeta variegata TaxID=151549 RepID=A0A4C1UKI6_EUMVA|nr:hypothetical protein EVAR_16408_1 [Eumeta japonica]
MGQHGAHHICVPYFIQNRAAVHARVTNVVLKRLKLTTSFPLPEYNLWLRPYIGLVPQSDLDAVATEQPVNLWRKVVVPGDVNDGPIHSALYTVRGLRPSTVYEAMVTSRNSFGWSKPSAVLHFATEPGVTGSRPATSDYSELPTPILEDLEERSTDTSLAQVSEQTSAYPDSAARENLTFLVILFCTVTWTLS